jgi:hypothetical protein
VPEFSVREKGGNPGNQGVSVPSKATFYPLGWDCTFPEVV